MKILSRKASVRACRAFWFVGRLSSSVLQSTKRTIVAHNNNYTVLQPGVLSHPATQSSPLPTMQHADVLSISDRHYLKCISTYITTCRIPNQTLVCLAPRSHPTLAISAFGTHPDTGIVFEYPRRVWYRGPIPYTHSHGMPGKRPKTITGFGVVIMAYVLYPGTRLVRHLHAQQTAF